MRERLRGLIGAAGIGLAVLALALAAGARDRAGEADAPALWKVNGPKGHAYLFGSFHLLPVDVKWRTPAVDRALNEAKVVVVESDVAGDDPQVMQPLIAKYGVLPHGQTLRGILPKSTHAELEKTAMALQLPPPTLAPLRPWLAAVTLGVQFIIKQGLDPSHGVDQQVIAWARTHGKALATLETNESQIRIFADLSPTEEIALLTVTLRQIRETPQMLNDMLSAYRKGDVAALEKTLNMGFEDFPALRARVLKDRHDKWLPQIEKMLADGRTHIIIVGAAHLVGPDSVVAMLRAKGVQIDGP